ncbi:MAG TPA: phytase, partial [Pseudomonadales bacterium]
MPRKSLPILLLASALGACGGAERSPSASGPERPATVALAPAGQTPPPAQGSLASAGFWQGPGEAGDGLIVAAAGLAGVTIHAPDGRQLGALEGIDAGLVTVVPPRAGAGRAQVVVYDSAAAALEVFTLEGNAPELVNVTAEPLALEDEATGLCHYRSRLAGADYVYAVTDAGLVLHFELYAVGERTAGRLLRAISVGKGAGYCAVDAETGTLYVSEEDVGIWRMGAEPESDTTREPLALAAPWGDLSDEVKGIAVYRDGDEAWLVAADAGEDRLAVLDAQSGAVVGRATVEGLGEAEGIAAVAAFGDAWPEGLLAIADEDAENGSNLKLVDWRALASALELAKASASGTETAPPATVRPVLETEIAASYGDAADDPAIWVHPDDPEKSLVIGTDKQLGLYVFDLEGRTLQTVPDGRMNNVDLRDGFPLGGGTVTLVTASNRSDDTIAAYRLDA